MERTCRKCGEAKEMDLFKRDKTCANGYRHTCVACFRAEQSLRHHSSKNDPAYRALLTRNRRKHDLKRKYGLTPEQADKMIADGCAICGRQQGRRLAIDHCHKTGRVRGALCTSCNNGIGLFRDSQELLKRAADYLLSS